MSDILIRSSNCWTYTFDMLVVFHNKLSLIVCSGEISILKISFNRDFVSVNKHLNFHLRGAHEPLKANTSDFRVQEKILKAHQNEKNKHRQTVLILNYYL